MQRTRVWAALALAGSLGLVPERARGQATLIHGQRISAIVHLLADDSMRGRATGSPELESAAAWVAGALRGAGLDPAGDGGGYVQRFPVGGDSTAPNVIAVLPGRDPRLAREFVLAVAHLDHVGVGRPVNGDSIRNGADDNASGTAGLVAIAEAFGSAARPPRRSLLFLVTTGEERGLRGSRWYAEHPTVSLADVVALVNLDMIGRNRPDSVYLNGWGKSAVWSAVLAASRAHPELGLGVGPDVEDRPVTPADSDHWAFQRLGIPYAFFYTGQHADYHGVGDEPARIDADKAARIARLAYYVIESLAEQDSRPTWDPESRRLNVVDRR